MALPILPFLAFLLSLSPAKPSSVSLPSPSSQHTRAAFISSGITCFGPTLNPAFAFEDARSRQAAVAAATSTSVGVGKDRPSQSAKAVIYRPLSIDVDGIQVPVAAWHPSDDRDDEIITEGNTYYEHRISISKIGKFLAGWSLPSFLDRDFRLRPSSIDVKTFPPNEGGLPSSRPVVLLANGFLGSRSDLSHLGESLASEGFLALAPEYPESLAATYDVEQGTTTGMPIDLFDGGMGRSTGGIYGIVGHSLGCGTVDGTGDETWTRVCLAGGYPSLRGPNCLFVGSINDGAVPLIRAARALRENDFESLEEHAVRSRSWNILPSRAYLIFRNQLNAPNHISFLAEGPNDAMVEFLSPLLPLARALGIPLLDFDKYQLSRDGKATGEVVIPLVVDYMKQKMKPIT